MDAWVPDITWSGAGSGTEGDLVIRQGSYVHRQGSSHAWGGNGWREDSSSSSAVWTPWTTPCSPLLARISGVDVDVDNMSTSWRGVWTQTRRPKAFGPVHSLSTASSAGAAPRMWMVGGAKAP